MLSSTTLAQIDYVRWVLDLAWEYEEEMLVEETIIRAVNLAYRFYRLPKNVRQDLEKLMAEAQEVMEDAQRNMIKTIIEVQGEDDGNADESF